MSKLSSFRTSLPLATLFAGALLMVLSGGAGAQQRPSNNGQGQDGAYYVERGGNSGVGGYSLRLSDIWGPAKMPPAPKDFGPHFDFPPEPLNGAPLHDPYPN